jgi:hypothetical protein
MPISDDLAEDAPRWERGDRIHGYWLGSQRLGWVALPHRGQSAAKAGYSWGIDAPGWQSKPGWSPTLSNARRSVEKAISAIERLHAS